MARKVRPVHCWGIVKRDYVNIKGFGDCLVLTDPRYLADEFDIIQFWVKTPLYQAYSVCVPEESYLNVVEFIDDNDEEFTEEIERVMMCELRKGDKFYFGSGQVKLIEQTSFMHFLLKPMNGRKQIDMRIIPTKVVRRVKKVRKTKPLSFTEFALSSYERALGRLAEAVMKLQLDSARVEVQKPAKKAENTSPVITAKDVPSPAPVASKNETCTCTCKCESDEDCDRSYCIELDASKITTGAMNLDNIQVGYINNNQTGHYDDHVMTCSDVIAELEEVRQHEGDLPVSIVNPEDGFRRVNVSGSMLEDLYEHGETYWGSRTWDTQPQPGIPTESELVVSLW